MTEADSLKERLLRARDYLWATNVQQTEHGNTVVIALARIEALEVDNMRLNGEWSGEKKASYEAHKRIATLEAENKRLHDSKDVGVILNKLGEAEAENKRLGDEARRLDVMRVEQIRTLQERLDRAAAALEPFARAYDQCCGSVTDVKCYRKAQEAYATLAEVKTNE
jgi:hypothetical protein